MIILPTGIEVLVNMYLRDTELNLTCVVTGNSRTIADDFVSKLAALNTKEDFGDNIRLATAEEIAEYKSDSSPEIDLTKHIA